MTWENFKETTERQNDVYIAGLIRVPTNIECPVCRKMLWKRTDKILTSNPPKKQYECDCGWVGYA